MRVIITTSGDPSVGISGSEVAVDFIGLPDEVADDWGRDDLRRQLEHFFADLLDAPAFAFFDDECPDCGKIVEKGLGCLNTCCISNQPDTC